MGAIADGSSLEVEKSTHMRMSLLFCYYQVKLRIGGDHVNVTWPLKALKGNAHTHALTLKENKSFL